MIKNVTYNENLGVFHSFMIYMNYAFLICIGHLYDFVENLLGLNEFSTGKKKNYAPLVSEFEAFYTRRLYARIQDCWNRPIKGTPGAWVEVMERKPINKLWKTQNYLTGRSCTCLNLSSYNYLGFSNNEGPILESVVDSVYKYGISTTSPHNQLGRSKTQEDVEELLAKFLGKEAVLIFTMGFATNSTLIPVLTREGDLIVSDSLNHASLVVGCRSSEAVVKVFRHNDFVELEKILQDAIWNGQSHPPRPWKRIFIVIEGIYSMEGEICDLPRIIELKKKYKTYLYIDEAHSIGALGKNARGICDYWNIPTSEVDILMGTFSKSFASVGGYVAADRHLIEYLRLNSYGQVYEPGISVGCIQQILGVLNCIMGLDNTDIGVKKIKQLNENSNYFRQALIDRGFSIFGSKDSPVVPLMLYYPAKISEASRDCFNRNIATVVVGFPATSIVESRIRFCISASHTKEDLDWAIKEIDQVGDRLLLKYNS